MHSVLCNRSFRNLWLAGLLSMAGSQISRVGLVLYLFQAHDSAIEIALLVVVKTLPAVLAAPAAGLVVDRFRKRSVMVAADLARAGLLVAILLWPSIWVIYLVAACESLATVVFDPARSASIPLVVDRRQVADANAVERSALNLVMVLGPIVGAELFLQLGLAATLALDALSYLGSALFVLRVGIREVAPEEAQSAAAGIRAGWSYLARDPLVLHLTAMFFISMLCGGLWVPLAPFFIRDFLGGSERVLGLQLGAFGLGGVLGGLWAPRLGTRRARGAVLFAALLVEGVHITVYSLVPNVAGSVVVLFLWGATFSVIAVFANSILQLNVSERFLGRVLSIVQQGENVAMLLAMLVTALLAERLSSHLIFLAAGLFYCGIVAASTLTRGGRTLLATP